MSKTNQADSVVRVYAQALLDIAQENHQMLEVADQLQQLDDLLNAHPELLGLLSSRVVPTQERTGIIETVFNGRVGDLLYRFLQVVNSKGRLDILPGIIRAYALLVDERNGVVEVDVFVASPLSEDQTQKVADGISGVVGRNVVLRKHIDPHLIGGLRVRVGDRLIDGSVAAGLRMMRHRLTDIGRQQARTQTGMWIQE